MIAYGAMNGLRIMTKLAIAVFAVGVTSGLAAAQAQPHLPDRLNVYYSDRHAPPSGWFIGGYAIDGANGRWVVEFFNVYNEGRAPTFAARRALDAFNGQEQEQRTDTSECPAIGNVLEALNNLAAPPVRVNNLRRAIGPIPPSQPASGLMPTDGLSSYTVWGRSVQGDGSFADSRFSAGTGPIAAFGRFAETQLADCWTRVG